MGERQFNFDGVRDFKAFPAPCGLVLLRQPTHRLAKARNEDAAIINKDEDFLDHWLLSDPPVPLVWVRRGNCSNRALLAWLEPSWPEVVKRLEQGDKFILRIERK